MITTTPTTWGHRAMPPSFEDCVRSMRRVMPRRSKRYEVDVPSYSLFVRAIEAKRAKRPSRRLKTPKATIELPAENIAAIKLLDSWLAMPETDSGERAEGIRRRIDENRLSDRKFFT